jgi:hypothetical protein
MKSAPAVVLGCLLALSACGKAGGSPSTPDSAGGGAIAASEVGEHGEKYKGQKVKVVGVYMSSFSKGGGPADPWALVIGDAPSSTATVACVIPAKAEIAGRSPKLTAVGTVKADPGDRVYLEGCTYTVEKLLAPVACSISRGKTHALYRHRVARRLRLLFVDPGLWGRRLHGHRGDERQRCRRGFGRGRERGAGRQRCGKLGLGGHRRRREWQRRSRRRLGRRGVRRKGGCRGDGGSGGIGRRGRGG